MIPWLDYWNQKFFLDKFPVLIPVLLHPSVRGAIDSLGTLDILLASNMLRGRTDSVARRT